MKSNEETLTIGCFTIILMIAFAILVIGGAIWIVSEVYPW